MLLGLHTYSLNLHGIGQAWAGFTLPWPRQISTFDLLDMAASLDLDGFHIDDGVLENLDSGYVKEVGVEAKKRGLYLEYNFSLDFDGQGIGIQHDLGEAIKTAHDLGSDVVKMSMDIKRPRPVSGSRFHRQVVKKMRHVEDIVRSRLSMAENLGVRIALENHCDSFSEEILWLLDKIGHPYFGACIDTVNALMVMEDPMTAITNLAPRAFTNHFRDDMIRFERYGFSLIGTSVGEGDIDMNGAYQIFREKSGMKRINIETEMNIPLDDMETALALEIDAVKRSVLYCRDVLGIAEEPGDRYV